MVQKVKLSDEDLLQATGGLHAAYSDVTQKSTSCRDITDKTACEAQEGCSWQVTPDKEEHCVLTGKLEGI